MLFSLHFFFRHVLHPWLAKTTLMELTRRKFELVSEASTIFYLLFIVVLGYVIL